jgi:hypothetical protein
MLCQDRLGIKVVLRKLTQKGWMAFFTQDDTRTNLELKHDGFKWCYTLNCTIAMMRRDTFTAGLTGRGIYQFDLFGAGWLGKNGTATERGNTSAIWKAISGAQAALAKAKPLAAGGPLPFPETAVFVDERAALTQPLGQGQWGVKNLNEELLRMGSPHRSYYVDDLPSVDT